MKPWMTAVLIVAWATQNFAAAPATTQPAYVRVAMIGGMNETGFWEGLVARFEKETGIHVDTVATGPKEGIGPVFAAGGVDVISMHASDTIMNLVADGLAMDPQPWARNDMILVGPANDPAGVKGSTGVAAAMRKIIKSKSPFVVHSSLGAQEVLRGILDATDLQLDEGATSILIDDKQRRVLHIAAEKNAYTLIGRIPFLSGKIPNDGMVAMTAGLDRRMCRPFVVAIANPAKVKEARVAEARRMVEFLRSPDTQKWIGEFGKGKYDDRSLFTPLELPGKSSARPAR